MGSMPIRKNELFLFHRSGNNDDARRWVPVVELEKLGKYLNTGFLLPILLYANYSMWENIDNSAFAINPVVILWNETKPNLMNTKKIKVTCDWHNSKNVAYNEVTRYKIIVYHYWPDGRTDNTTRSAGRGQNAITGYYILCIIFFVEANSLLLMINFILEL